MSLTGCQEFVRQALDNLASPQLDPTTAYVSQPNPGSMPTPQVYIWGGRGRDIRQTAPRGSSVSATAGFRVVEWEFDVWLYVALQAHRPGTDPRYDYGFPLLLDAVTTALRTLPMPTDFTDPVTGGTTSILKVAENMTIIQATPRTLSPQGLVRFAAQGIVDLWEQVQA